MANSSATLSADGSTTAAIWPGGVGVYAAFGDFGSGTLQMEVSYDDESTWISTGSDGSFTADSMVTFEPGTCKVRATLTGASSPSLTVVFIHTRADRG